MSHSVTVLITGIALLVNGPKPSASPAPTVPPPAYVLLANNAAPQQSVFYPAPEAGGGVVPRHVAFVQFRLADLVTSGTTRTVDATFAGHDALGNPETYGLCFLNAESIDLSVSASPADLTADNSACVIPSTTTVTDKLPFTCVTPLSVACKECGTLRSVADMPAGTVGAQLNLTTGHLTSTHIEPAKVWFFDPQPSSLPLVAPQPMPQAVALDFPLPGTTTDLTLSFADLPTSSTTSTLTLRASSDPLVVTVGSAPLEDLLGRETMLQATDHHFELYYGFFDMGTLHRPPIPKRVGTDAEPVAGVVPLLLGNSNCPPSAWP